MEIKNRSGKVMYTSTKETIKEALEEAVYNSVNLSGADLSGAEIDPSLDIRKLLKIK